MGVYGLLVAEFVEVVGLARLERGDAGVAGSVQRDGALVGDVAEELPAGPRQRVVDGRTAAAAQRFVQQLVEGPRNKQAARVQISGKRSKYSSSSFFPPCPLPTLFSLATSSMALIHLTIL